MDLCDHLKNCRVYGAEQSTYDLLPRESAVYAFYDIFRFQGDNGHLIANQIDTFKTKHGRRISVSDEELPFKISLRLRGNPDRFKGEGLRICKKLDIQKVPIISKSLAFLSVVNDPLYIGKTNNVKERFKAHHDNGFLWKMKNQSSRSADEFLFFVYLCDESVVRVLESVLIQLINPPFCDQKT